MQFSGNSACSPTKEVKRREMEDEIRSIEKEAYLSVLRAFTVQSDTISWERSELLIGIREELRITSLEHNTLLRRVKADKRFRKLRGSRRRVEQLATGDNMSQYGQHRRVEHLAIKDSMSQYGHHRRVEHLATKDGMSRYGHRLSHNPIIPSLFGNLSGHNREVNTSSSLDHPSHTPETRKGKELANVPIRKMRYKMGGRIIPDNKVVKYGDHSGQDHRLEESPSIKPRDPRLPRVKELTIDPYSSKFLTSQKSIQNRSLDNIETYNTKALIDKADEILNASFPDPLEMANMEKILNEHEENLENIISMLEEGEDA